MKNLEKIFGRVAIPMITPFDESSEVDCDKACLLAERLIERQYCDSIILSGTNGEFHSLGYSERVALFEAVQSLQGKIPLVAGTGACTTQETILLTRKAESLGYDAAMVVPPYFGTPTQDELFSHYSEVAEAVTIPIVLYNIPVFTGVNIEPKTTSRLAEIQNIIGIKDEAALHPLQSSEVFASIPADKDFAVYCGDDTMTLQVLVQGGSGVVSGGSHVVGDLMKEMIERFFTGNVNQATRLHKIIYRFAGALTPGSRVNPVPLTKAALALTGFDAGIPRKPFLPPSKEETENLQQTLEAIGKL
ncbi:MAG TPA: 4-hydroxy-tetrahydrodipicolinate synthase [bacterium]|nr:4-hydroxy-tetrahydrodipicolinate synthase [bacterium]